MDLGGKLIIVTGSSSGLGRALAWRLATREGADVILAARRRERLEELRAAIGATGPGSAFVCEVDLASPGGPETLMRRALEIARSRDGAAQREGGIFGLVNNAGVTHYGPLSGMSADDLRRVIDLNVTATMEITRRFVHYRAIEHPGPGAVLTITSLAAHLLAPYQSAYTATKHAQQAYMNALSFELSRAARRGAPRVVVTAFAPGGIATEMNELSGLHARFATESAGTPERSILLMPADKVAAQAIRAWKRERRESVGGLGNAFAVAAGRVLPTALLGRLAERVFRP